MYVGSYSLLFYGLYSLFKFKSQMLLLTFSRHIYFLFFKKGWGKASKPYPLKISQLCIGLPVGLSFRNLFLSLSSCLVLYCQICRINEHLCEERMAGKYVFASYGLIAVTSIFHPMNLLSNRHWFSKWRMFIRPSFCLVLYFQNSWIGEWILKSIAFLFLF